MEELDDIFKKGVVKDLFHAQRHLDIWLLIGEEYSFLNGQDQVTKSLYGYIQSSALDQLILSLSKLLEKYHKPNKTRCLLRFLDLWRENILRCDIHVKYLREYLVENKLPISLQINLNSHELLLQIISHFQNVVENDPDNHIYLLKRFRDKFVVHNEVYDSISLSHDSITYMMDVVYKVTLLWQLVRSDAHYNIKDDAYRGAYFVVESIGKLK